MLNTLNMLIGVFVQNLFLVAFYEKACLIQRPFRIHSTFFAHLSSYVVSLLGIDHSTRIKYYAKFKPIWKTKVVITLLFIESLLAIFQTVMLEVRLSYSKGLIAIIFYCLIDGITISMIMFLQIQAFRTSNAIKSVSSSSSASRGNKIVTKFCVNIALMLYFFSAPHAIVMTSLRFTILDEFVINKISTFEVIYSITIIFVYVDSFAKSLLFLMTNVKAKRFFQALIR